MKINAVKTVEVEAKKIRIHVKCCDYFDSTLEDQDGKKIVSTESAYVPGWFPGEHFGDYLILDIDIDSGQITNWQQPSAEVLQDWIEEQADVD